MYRSKMLLEHSEFCALLWWAQLFLEPCSFMKATNASGTNWSVIIAIVISAHFIVGRCMFWRVNCDVLFSQVIGRPRIKRVTHKDLQFLMEQDHHLCKSPLLYRTFLKWEQLCLANLTPAWTDTQPLWSLQENRGAEVCSVILQLVFFNCWKRMSFVSTSAPTFVESSSLIQS